MKKFLALMATGTALAFAGTASNAATCTDCGSAIYTDNDSQVLTNLGTIGYAVSNISSGTFSYASSFNNEATLPGSLDVTVQQFQPTNLASINNLTITAYSDSNYSSELGAFAITDANGRASQPLGSYYDVLFSDLTIPLGMIYFTVTGDAVASAANLPPSFQFQVSAVPVPATGLLLLGGLGVLGFAGRRKKKAANA